MLRQTARSRRLREVRKFRPRLRRMYQDLKPNEKGCHMHAPVAVSTRTCNRMDLCNSKSCPCTKFVRDGCEISCPLAIPPSPSSGTPFPHARQQSLSRTKRSLCNYICGETGKAHGPLELIPALLQSLVAQMLWALEPRLRSPSFVCTNQPGTPLGQNPLIKRKDPLR